VIPARAPEAGQARAVVDTLQRRMVAAMQAIDGVPFVETTWLRDEGTHGGGVRWSTGDTTVFDRGSVNVSQVHYDDLPDRKLASATALSTIIHPRNPHAPSVHLHVSWTAMRDGSGYWRMMADLNPAIAASVDRSRFENALRGVAGELYDYAAEQGARYFWIPALDRHRGVAHFYLEGHASGDFAKDAALATALGNTTIDVYAAVVKDAIAAHPQPTAADRAAQLAYHTVYLFQVLTLDRGTTSGLLVHDQNDIGILGSLPSHVDRDLLASWASKVQPPQDILVHEIVRVLRGDTVDDDTKRELAAVVREFYRAYPEALAMQATGDVVPPTVANHR
jgi:coproporphyrinogen III oxidase